MSPPTVCAANGQDEQVCTQPVVPAPAYDTREPLKKSARAVGERLRRKLRLKNRRNTLCISRFLNRKVAAKDPSSAAADLFRGSLEFDKKLHAFYSTEGASNSA